MTEKAVRIGRAFFPFWFGSVVWSDSQPSPRTVRCHYAWLQPVVTSPRFQAIEKSTFPFRSRNCLALCELPWRDNFCVPRLLKGIWEHHPGALEGDVHLNKSCQNLDSFFLIVHDGQECA